VVVECCCRLLKCIDDCLWCVPMRHAHDVRVCIDACARMCVSPRICLDAELMASCKCRVTCQCVSLCVTAHMKCV